MYRAVAKSLFARLQRAKREKKGFSGDTPDPGKGLAALCNPAFLLYSQLSAILFQKDKASPQAPAATLAE